MCLCDGVDVDWPIRLARRLILGAFNLYTMLHLSYSGRSYSLGFSWASPDYSWESALFYLLSFSISSYRWSTFKFIFFICFFWLFIIPFFLILPCFTVEIIGLLLLFFLEFFHFYFYGFDSGSKLICWYELPISHCYSKIYQISRFTHLTLHTSNY